MVELLKQPQYEPLSVEKQVLLIFLGSEGFLDEVPVAKLGSMQADYYSFVESNYPDILKDLAEKKAITDDIRERLQKMCAEFVKMFEAK